MDPPQEGDDDHANVPGAIRGMVEQLGLGEGTRVVDLQVLPSPPYFIILCLPRMTRTTCLRELTSPPSLRYPISHLTPTLRAFARRVSHDRLLRRSNMDLRASTRVKRRRRRVGSRSVQSGSPELVGLGLGR